MKNHFQHLFTNIRDIRILVSFLAYIVQTKKRPNWAVVLQGVDGDGKTFIADLMTAILGNDNVYIMGPQTLQSSFNKWAEGHLLTCIEEIRLVGHSRYDILNRIKPLITNEMIEIHGKNLNPYNVPNTSAYLAMTNYRDALPLTDNDRRYFIVMSRWQDGETLKAFLARSPTYFHDLYAALTESPGALHRWLLGYKLDEEFQPQGRAPFSQGREQMIAINRTDEAVLLDEILAEGKHRDISKVIVVVSSLVEQLYDEKVLIGVTTIPNIIKRLLTDAGFDLLGQIMIKGERESVWTKTPEKWSHNPALRGQQVRQWLAEDL